MPLLVFTFNFGSGKAHLSTVGYQLFNDDWTAYEPRTTQGVHESGSGAYAASVEVPNDFSGFVRGDTGENVPRYDVYPINPLVLPSRPPQGYGETTVSVSTDASPVVKVQTGASAPAPAPAPATPAPQVLVSTSAEGRTVAVQTGAVPGAQAPTPNQIIIQTGTQ